MISAPMSPRDIAANGPASTRVRSMTRTPARGPPVSVRDDFDPRGFFSALFTRRPFPEAFDEALADGGHLLAAIPRAPPEQPRTVGEAHVGEVEHRVHVLDGHARADLHAAGLLTVTEQPRAALELDDRDVKRRTESLRGRVERRERHHLAHGRYDAGLHADRVIGADPGGRCHDAPAAGTARGAQGFRHGQIARSGAAPVLVPAIIELPRAP